MEFDQELLSRVNRNGLYAAVGLTSESAEGGRAVTRMTPPPEVRWPSPDQPHGGVIALQIDITMGMAVVSTIEPDGNVSTVDLNVQYLAPAKGEFFMCEATVVHQTGRMRFVHARTTDDAGRPIALAQSVFRTFRNQPIVF